MKILIYTTKMFKRFLGAGIVLAPADSNVRRHSQSSLGMDSLKEAKQVQRKPWSDSKGKGSIVEADILNWDVKSK